MELKSRNLWMHLFFVHANDKQIILFIDQSVNKGICQNIAEFDLGIWQLMGMAHVEEEEVFGDYYTF